MNVTHEITVDLDRPLIADPRAGHNRWHPDIPAVLRCVPGDIVAIDTRDGYDGQFGRASTADDVLRADLARIHPLTGPIHIEGAEPGDLLVVDVLSVDTGNFGATLNIPGFGFLREEFTEPHIVRWEIADGFAHSADLPGVRLPGAPFMGVMGVAPSRALFDRTKAAEQRAAQGGGLVELPNPTSAVPPDRAADPGRRTISPTEAAGNVDIKHLTAGSRVHLPVWVPGALFSVGDGHFAQGDGESCGAAVETTARVVLRFDLRKGAAAAQDSPHLSFERLTPGPPDVASRPHFAVTGIPVDSAGEIHPENLNMATRNALRLMVDHLSVDRGFTRQQAYALCSVAVDLRLSQIVDAPNILVSALIPTDIFV
ncbi:acetamidase/formamidase family protein [Mycolicibacterium smegmatis]|uniref:Formamidase n=2 Tax=Mycolicibacterium smegmatis (strain ATCC 700084 / mc(2)155) TaxID=246196 RepID=A0QPQ9_MYCS2|nr:acetamidase/formamidase family protein [Mycolicibacterium smegmatis]ABK73843.1 formamidase [Mycolicibacterium smegmatis MC2 155]AFP36952.1 Formamidase [Mycolicibacterium smegmatis MC2 155]AIU05754.1 formamidase [Mycolicibacterium smegmatis MC2 155]AIU12379.1 formamidase [Mycolicibacterium smegmatis]AIU19003.1 formamidase [Mycolicibacterium smegmatis]